MQPYADINGDSGVAAFQVEGNAITVRFKDGSTYVYTYASAGKAHVEAMKQLAARGDGLNSYIKKYVRKNYARKL